MKLSLDNPHIDPAKQPSPTNQWYLEGDFNVRDSTGVVIHSETVRFLAGMQDINLPAGAEKLTSAVYIPENESKALAVLLGKAPGTWEFVVCCHCDQDPTTPGIVTVDSGPAISTWSGPVRQKIPVGCKDCSDGSDS
jgi:hypothetical protein